MTYLRNPCPSVVHRHVETGRCLLLMVAFLGLGACAGSSDNPSPGSGGTGGGASSGTGGHAETGGAQMTGSGGGPGSGGAVDTGGAPGSGGITIGTGGALGTGGGASGGTPAATGGRIGAGGGGGVQTGSGGTGAGGSGSGGTASGGSTGFAPCPASGVCAIMPLGDSITQGYGQTDNGGYRVYLLDLAVAAKKSITFIGSQRSGPAKTPAGNTFPQSQEGYSGYCIDDNSSCKGGISGMVDGILSKAKPNIILLMIGTNDMHYSIDLANAPTRLGKLIDKVTTDAPNALLVVAKIVPANGTQNTPTQTYNAAIPGLVQTRVAQGKHIIVVDMFAALKTWSSALFKDSEHPNDAGYTLMAQTWYPAISPYLP